MTRWRWRTAISGVTVLTLLMSTVTGGTADPLPTPPAAPPAPDATGTATITLLTGDVVTYRFTGDGTPVDATVAPAPRADGDPVLFTQVRDGRSYYVYPSDVVGLVEAGKLDRRLFDVSYQTEYGFTDEARPSLPLIVRRPARAAALPATTNVRALPAVHGVALSVTRSGAAAFWSAVDEPAGKSLAAGVSTIWLDGTATASLDQSVAKIGAPEAWKSGYTGKDVSVAVLDTGIDAAHPDLAGRVSATQSFVAGQQVQDGHGHGTHVASTIVGSGAATNGKYRGVAPDATLLVGKVLGDDGRGQESGILAGMTWAAEQGADVVNMSLGSCCGDGTDPLSQAVNDLSTRYDTLFVVAAGNEGDPLTVGSPGAADAALTVAAVDRQDRRAEFSSQGPRVGDYALKPDLAGPGVGIVAARAAGTVLGTPVDDRYTAASGTSMATPHVAGAAAILAQRHPEWSGQQLKSALIGSAARVEHPAYETGSGRVDVARAVRQGVVSSGNVDFGRLADADSGPVTATITYTNTTAEPVTLDLAATFAGDALSVPETVTVPANGAAPVTVTLDPAGLTAWCQGTITATAGDLRLHNTVAGYVPPPRHRLTARIALPPGATDVTYQPWYLMRLDDVGDLDQRDNMLIGTAGASIDGHLDDGTYSVHTAIDWRDANGDPQVMLLTDATVRVDRDTVLTLDGRQATRVNARTPRSALTARSTFGYRQQTATALRAFTVTGESRYADHWGLWATPTERVDPDSFTWTDQRLLMPSPVSMAVGDLDLDARYLSEHIQDARFDGRRRLPLTAAGHGLAADYAGTSVRGKVVLVDVSDLCPATRWTCDRGVQDRVTLADANGAAGVLVFGGAGRAVAIDDRNDSIVTPIPALTVPAARGAVLRDRLAGGDRVVSVRATATTPYVYSLSFPATGRVPATLDLRVSPRDLYEFDSRYHADAPGTATLTWSSRVKPNIGLGTSSMTVRAPGTLREYVGPMRAGERRTRSVILTYDGTPDMHAFHRNGYSQTRNDVLTRPGSRTDVFGRQPYVHAALRTVSPADNDYAWQLCTACRSGDIFMPWHIRDSDGRGGGVQTYYSDAVLQGQPQTQLRLWGPDGKEVPVREGLYRLFIVVLAVPYFELPAAVGRYRMTESYPAPFLPQKWARQVNTEWTFETGTPVDGFPHRPPTGVGVHCGAWDTITHRGAPDTGTCAPNSQLYLGWDLDLELDNTAPAGSRRQLTVSGYHHSYLADDPEMTRLRLSVSFDDGRTWEQLRTRKSGRGEYTATVTHPKRHQTTGAVSLRAEGVDTEGNTVKQTISRAYGLR
ncbi:S8 family serine peptidase [Actinophytocola sediminis]